MDGGKKKCCNRETCPLYRAYQERSDEKAQQQATATKSPPAIPSGINSTQILFVEPNFTEAPSEYEVFYDCISSEYDTPSLGASLCSSVCPKRNQTNKLVKSSDDPREFRGSLQRIMSTTRRLLKYFDEAGQRDRRGGRCDPECFVSGQSDTHSHTAHVEMTAKVGSGGSGGSDGCIQGREVHLDQYTLRIEPLTFKVPLQIKVTSGHPCKPPHTCHVSTMIQQTCELDPISTLEPIRTATITATTGQTMGPPPNHKLLPILAPSGLTYEAQSRVNNGQEPVTGDSKTHISETQFLKVADTDDTIKSDLRKSFGENFDFPSTIPDNISTGIFPSPLMPTISSSVNTSELPLPPPPSELIPSSYTFLSSIPAQAFPLQTGSPVETKEMKAPVILEDTQLGIQVIVCSCGSGHIAVTDEEKKCLCGGAGNCNICTKTNFEVLAFDPVSTSAALGDAPMESEIQAKNMMPSTSLGLVSQSIPSEHPLSTLSPPLNKISSDLPDSIIPLPLSQLQISPQGLSLEQSHLISQHQANIAAQKSSSPEINQPQTSKSENLRKMKREKSLSSSRILLPSLPALPSQSLELVPQRPVRKLTKPMMTPKLVEPKEIKVVRVRSVLRQGEVQGTDGVGAAKPIPPPKPKRKKYYIAFPQYKHLETCSICRYDPSPLMDEEGNVICPFNCGCCLCPWTASIVRDPLDGETHAKFKVCKCREKGGVFTGFNSIDGHCSNKSLFDICPCREKAEIIYSELYGEYMWDNNKLNKKVRGREVLLSEVIDIKSNSK